MPKVEHVSIWLRWAVDPASALRVLLLPLLLALPMHLLLPSCARTFRSSSKKLATPSPRSSSSRTPPPLRSASRQRSLPGARAGDAALFQGPGDLALLAYSVVMFSFLRLVLSHSLFLAMARRWGIRKAGKMARFSVPFGGVGVWRAFPVYFRYARSFAVHPLHQPRLLRAQAPHAGLLTRQALPCLPFSNAHARPCVDWRLASAWNADAKSPLLGLGVIPDSRRAVPVRAPFTFWGCFVPSVILDPNSMRMPTKQPLRWALFSGMLNRVSRCGCEASTCMRVTGPGDVYAQRAVDRYRYRYWYPFVRLRRLMGSHSRVGVGFYSGGIREGEPKASPAIRERSDLSRRRLMYGQSFVETGRGPRRCWFPYQNRWFVGAFSAKHSMLVGVTAESLRTQRVSTILPSHPLEYLLFSFVPVQHKRIYIGVRKFQII
ncbi:hypothetical protein B0H13DRAFT_1898297 [Mycena leptocephala]|nr:hypothetical protein B0H13DRAFT_1898297 [Mycena leptocephala]